MFKAITREKTHRLIGYLPEFRQYLLRNLKNGKLELWQVSHLMTGGEYLIFHNQELECVREVQHAWRVVDSEYNRANYLDEIGRIYVDRAPSYVAVKDL